MKFEIYSEVLKKALASASNGLPKKTLTPVLKNFLFEVRKGKLWIITTKGVMTVGVEVPEVELDYLPYRIIFDSQTITNIAKASTDVISFDCAPRKAIIKSGKSEVTLQLQDASEYPEINSLNVTSWETVAREPFITAVNAVKEAASFDPQRPSLCAVNVNDNNFQAANGMTLHKVKSDFAYPNMNIPSHAIPEILSILRGTNEEYFQVRPAKNGIGIKVGNATMIIGALSEEYPDVSSAILKPTLINEDVVDIEKTEFLQAVKRCNITTDDTNKILTVELRPGKIRLSSKNQQGSHTVEEIDTYWSEDAKVRVNVRAEQLRSAIDSCPLMNMSLYLGREENARLPSVLVKSDEAQYSAVVTQIRTDLL